MVTLTPIYQFSKLRREGKAAPKATELNSPALIKASVYLLAARPCPHGLKSENLMREWAAQGKLFSFHVEKAQNQANKHLLIFSQ